MLGARRNVVIMAQKMSMPSLTYLSSIVQAPIALARASMRAPGVIKK